MIDDQRPQLFYITFLRHGESVGNAESRWQGQSDFPLTEAGRAQARALAERWRRENRKFDLAISSPLLRAKETAEIIASALNLQIKFDPLWLERDNGEFSGLTSEEVRQNFQRPPFYTPYDSVGGDGEGDWALFLRAGQALHRLLQLAPARYLVVSHGGMLNQVMHALMGLAPQANDAGTRFRFENAAFADLIYYPRLHRWVVERLNDRAHWENS